MDNMSRRLLYTKLCSMEPRMLEIKRHRAVLIHRQLLSKFKQLVFDLCTSPNESIGHALFQEQCASEKLTAVLQNLPDIMHSQTPACGDSCLTEVAGNYVGACADSTCNSELADCMLQTPNDINTTIEHTTRPQINADDAVQPSICNAIPESKNQAQVQNIDSSQQLTPRQVRHQKATPSSQKRRRRSRKRLSNSKLSRSAERQKQNGKTAKELDHQDEEALHMIANIQDDLMRHAWCGCHTLTLSDELIRVPRIVNKHLEKDLLMNACSEGVMPELNAAAVSLFFDSIIDDRAGDSSSNGTTTVSSGLDGSGDSNMLMPDGTSVSIPSPQHRDGRTTAGIAACNVPFVMNEQSRPPTTLSDPPEQGQHNEHDHLLVMNGLHSLYDLQDPVDSLLQEALLETHQGINQLEKCCPFKTPSCVLSSLIAGSNQDLEGTILNPVLLN